MVREFWAREPPALARTPTVYRRYGVAMTLRDLLVVGGCVFWEPRSLPAFWHLARSVGRALRHRRDLLARRRVGDEFISAWIGGAATARPVHDAACAAEALEYSARNRSLTVAAR